MNRTPKNVGFVVFSLISPDESGGSRSPLSRRKNVRVHNVPLGIDGVCDHVVSIPFSVVLSFGRADPLIVKTAF